MQFRLLTTGHQSATINMAIDEAVLDFVSRGITEPALRFYGWSPPAVSIGYFQSLEEELDLDACEHFGVEYVRRMTGGGAVFHDQEITYSMHIPISLGLVPNDILKSYRHISNGIIKGLERLGMIADFVPLNDIVLNGRKISGNAQTRRKNVILQHGTILLKVDVDKMFDLLKVPNEKLKGKLIETVKERVTSVSAAAGRDVSFEEALDVLIKGFKETFPSINFQNSTLSDEEQTMIEKLAREKYSSGAWNKKR